jgi:hypothetical protein
MGDDHYFIVTSGYGFEDQASREHEERDDAVRDFMNRVEQGIRPRMFEITPLDHDAVRALEAALPPEEEQ